MSVKLALLKSGETLISDMKEVVADVNQDKPTAFLFENPHLVDTKKKEGGKFDVILSPWLVVIILYLVFTRVAQLFGFQTD